jgi:hypothetical protein
VQTLQDHYFGAYRSLKLTPDVNAVLAREFHRNGGPFVFTAQDLTCGVCLPLFPDWQIERRLPTSSNQCKPRVTPSLGKEKSNESTERFSSAESVSKTPEEYDLVILGGATGSTMLPGRLLDKERPNLLLGATGRHPTRSLTALGMTGRRAGFILVNSDGCGIVGGSFSVAKA